MTSLITALLLSCGIVTATVGIQQPKPEPKVNADALLLVDLKQRIDKYMELHNRLEKKGPALKRTDEPAKIKASQDALAAAIQAERVGAKQGDIFTPEVAQLLRRLLAPEVKGKEGAETKKALKEDAPAPMRLKVNGQLPGGAALPTVPRTCSRPCRSSPRISSIGSSGKTSFFATFTRTWSSTSFQASSAEGGSHASARSVPFSVAVLFSV